MTQHNNMNRMKIAIKTQMPKNKNSNKKYQESYTKLKWDVQAQIEQKTTNWIE